MKKGFTLVELLAVITILSVLMVFAVPSIMKSRNGTIKKLNEMEKKNIKEAATLLAGDIDNQSNGKDAKSNCNSFGLTCEYNYDNIKLKYSLKKVTFKVSDLKRLGYYDEGEDAKEIKGTCNQNASITITANSNGYDVNTDNVTCKAN